MQIQISVLLMFFVSCSCSILKRIHRPERVQSPVRPGEQVVAVSEPECEFKGDNGQCCLTVSIAGINGIENCVKIGQEENNGYAAYIFSDHELVRKDLTGGERCFPIPDIPFRACIHIYYSNIDNTSAQGNVCMYVSINRVISLDFNCIRYNNGTFQHNKEHTPESEGLFNIDVANGKSNIYLGKPIEDSRF